MNFPCEAPPDFPGIVFPKELAVETTYAHCERIGHAFMDSDQIDVEKAQPLVKTSKVLHVARQTVKFFDDHSIKLAILSVGKEFY